MSWGSRLLVCGALMIGFALATGACTTYGVIENKPLLPGEGSPGYSLGAPGSAAPSR